MGPYDQAWLFHDYCFLLKLSNLAFLIQLSAVLEKQSGATQTSLKKSDAHHCLT